jgi:hypothetical protein
MPSARRRARRRRLSIALCLCAAGCLTPSEPWQQRLREVELHGASAGAISLVQSDPAAVESGGPASLAQRASELERRYVEDVEVEGVVWVPLRSDPAAAEPDRYGTGGDSLLFTGVAVAAWTWKYGVTGNADRLVEALRGLWILTHVAGPGVLCRAAFPSRRDAEFGWPSAWAGRDPRFVGETPAGAIRDPIRGGPLPAMRWYTRATRDQLTGLVLGLASVWALATAPTTDSELAAQLRTVVAEITADVVAQLRAHDWRIRDASGRNDTTADDVDGLLRVAVLGLARVVGVADADREYEREFRRAVEGPHPLDSFQRYSNLFGYYAHNLRAARTYSIWLLDADPERRVQIVDYARTRWRRWTDHHGNAWLSWLWFVMSGAPPDAEGLRALYELRWKPIRSASSPLAGRWSPPRIDAVIFDTTPAWVLPVYLRKPSEYFSWQKEPWGAGEPGNRGRANTTGLDFLAAYWLGRAHGFIPDR